MEVLINASDEPIKVTGGKDVLFSREFDGETHGAHAKLSRMI